MLHCVYHAVDDMKVVEDDERNRLLATGYWFSCPKMAKEMRDKFEKRIIENEKPRKRKNGIQKLDE
jgi:hypothetical protein